MAGGDKVKQVSLVDGENRLQVTAAGELNVNIISGGASGGGVNSTVVNLTLSTATIDASLHTCTTTAEDVSVYRDFVLCMSFGVQGSPTDVTVKAQFSSDGSTGWRTVQNWFWGDVVWDDATIGAATWDQPALIGTCPTQYFRAVAIHSGAIGTFTLSNWQLHLKD